MVVERPQKGSRRDLNFLGLDKEILRRESSLIFLNIVSSESSRSLRSEKEGLVQEGSSNSSPAEIKLNILSNASDGEQIVELHELHE